MEEIDRPEVFGKEAIEQSLAIICNDIKNRNTMTEQEFEKFSILYSEEGIKSLSESEKNRLTSEFQRTVSLFDPITVVDTNGNVVFTKPPALIPPKTWNDIPVPIVAEYMGAMEHSDPLRKPDLIIAEQIKQIIIANADNPLAMKYRAMYDEYQKNQIQSTPKESDGTVSENTDERIKINSDSLF